MSNFLVTGGVGFVGSHIIEEFYNNGHNITVLVTLTNVHLSNLSQLRNKITFHISKTEQIKFTISKKFDIIFHLATPSRSSSLIDSFQAIETICKEMVSVLELEKKDDAKVVFTGNYGIYGYSLELAITRMIVYTRKIQVKSNFLH